MTEDIDEIAGMAITIAAIDMIEEAASSSTLALEMGSPDPGIIPDPDIMIPDITDPDILSPRHQHVQRHSIVDILRRKLSLH